MDRDNFLEKIAEIKGAIQNVGGVMRCEHISAPADIKEIEAIERVYQVSLPEDFVGYLTTVAAEINIQWSFDRDTKLAVIKSLPTFLTRFNAIYSGSLVWSVKYLLANVNYFKRFNPDGIVLRANNTVTNDNALNGTVAICEVPCGDEIRMNLAAPTSDKPIFYLNHSDTDNSLIQLAPSFNDYVQQLLGIALVGSEIEQQRSFITEGQKGLDCNCKNALLWADFLKR